MNIELPFRNWNDIVRMSGKDSYAEEGDKAIAQPATKKQKRRAYIRKAVRKSVAKKKLSPSIGVIRG